MWSCLIYPRSNKMCIKWALVLSPAGVAGFYLFATTPAKFLTPFVYIEKKKLCIEHWRFKMESILALMWFICGEKMNRTLTFFILTHSACSVLQKRSDSFKKRLMSTVCRVAFSSVSIFYSRYLQITCFKPPVFLGSSSRCLGACCSPCFSAQHWPSPTQAWMFTGSCGRKITAGFIPVRWDRNAFWFNYASWFWTVSP